MSGRTHTTAKAAPTTASSFMPVGGGLLQRKRSGGGASMLRGERAESGNTQAAAQGAYGHHFSRVRVGLQTKLAVNQPGDAFEQEADRIADMVVGEGANSFQPITAHALSSSFVQRGEAKKPSSDEEKYKEGAKKIGEAFLETDVGKSIKERALKLGESFIATLAGKIVAGTAAAGAITAIAATNSELPMQVPEIPLDVLAPGLKLKLTYEGPAQKPTAASISFTYTPGANDADKKKPAQSESEKFRAETARLAADQAKFREGLKTPKERADDAAMWDAYWRMKSADPLNPLNIPGLKPKQGNEPLLPKKKEDGAVMRKEASATQHAHGKDGGGVPPIVGQTLAGGGGRPLDHATRRFMESRFGHDFSRVRVHTDARAAESARAVNALAYTVGHNVVFAEGLYAPETSRGRRLLAHELTHVVQQSGARTPVPTPRLMRQSCGHDGKGTGCGPGGGLIKFPGSILQLDQTVVKQGLEKDLGGNWLTEVTSPKNPKKPAKESGRIDGVKVSAEGALNVEVVEVKPRSPGSALSSEPAGGCAKATEEAEGYVSALKKLTPKIKTLSEKFSPNGFRLMDHHEPKGKVERAVFEKAGVNIDDKEWLDAWRFYNSLQQKLPKVFKKPFSSVNINLFTGGEKEKKYRAFGWMVKCKDNAPGIEELFYMVNKKGGVSYGCEQTCGRKKPQEETEEEPKEQPKEKPAPSPAPVMPEIEVHPLFESAFIWKSLPGLPPDSLVVFGVSEELFDGYVGTIQVQHTLEHFKIRLSPALFSRLEAAVILAVAAVGSVIVAATVSTGGLAGGGVAVAGTTAGAGTVAGGGTGGVVLIGRFLTTAAANDNAIKFAKAAGFLLALAAASQSTEAKAEETGTEAVKEVLKSNPTVLALRDATAVPQLDRFGARFLANNGKVYRVFAVARS